MPIASKFRRALRPALPLLSSIGLFGLAGAAGAQTADTVTWTLAAPSAAAVAPGARVALQLRGDVRPGWHVYGLKQLPEGPTPLDVTLEPGVAVAAGAPTGTAPIRQHDPSFDLQTQYYADDFTVTVPVRIAAKAPAGRQVVPVNVHFQTCNGSICHPPKTVRLTAPVNVLAAR